MLLITTALMMEARPLVAGLGLHARREALPVYENAAMRLVVTGTGPQRAAAATGWALGRFGETAAAINLGFCGAMATVAPLHHWLLIHSVRDGQTGRLLVPDILYQHPFAEAPLMTVPKVVREPIEWKGAVDMEGAGFFEAARQHLPAHRVAILKWVSDALTGHIDKAATAAAFEDTLGPVLAFMKSWEGEAMPVEQQTDGAVLAMGELCMERLRLTATQRAQLRRWVEGYARRGGTADGLLAVLPESPPNTRRENTVHFSRLRDALKS